MNKINITNKTKYSICQLAMLVIICFLMQTSNALGQDSATITIKFAGEAPLDSVQVTVWDHFILGGSQLSVTKSASRQKTDSWKLEFPLTRSQGIFYFKTFKGQEEDNSKYIPIVKGDNVQIIMGGNNCSFSGNGAEKMQIAYELEQIHNNLRTRYYDAPSPELGEPNTKRGWERATSHFFSLPLDSLLNVKLDYLAKFKKRLSSKNYLLLKANTIAYDYHSRLSKFNRWNNYGLVADSTQKNFYTDIYTKYLKALSVDVPDSVFTESPWFGGFLLFKRGLAIIFDSQLPKENRNFISYANTLPIRMREPFITCFLLMKGINKIEDSVALKALSFVKSPDYLNYLTGLRENLKLGDSAYNFALENVKGEKVRLSDFKGKVVFMDFWFTGCKWCKFYYEGTLKEVEEHFKRSKDIVFLSICIDPKKDLWLNSIKEGAYNGPESVNLYTEGQGTYHPLIKQYNIGGYPFQIIVDKEMRNYNIDNKIQEKLAPDLIKYLEDVVAKSPKG